MPLSTLPLELTDKIASLLLAQDVLSLLLLNKHFYTRFNKCLQRVAVVHKTPAFRHDELTNGLDLITFWFDKGGRGSVLEWAIFHGRRETYKHLIKLPGMDLVQEDSWGTTLLHRLSGQGSTQYMKLLIQQLKLTGKNPFQADGSLLTPLHYATGRGMSEAANLLIAMGANVSAIDHHGNTPLHLAAITGSYQVLDLLVEAGADVHAEARFGRTAIDQASFAHQYDTVQKLVNLGSRPSTCQKRTQALNEFVRLSPCPLECYWLHPTFGPDESIDVSYEH